jgi:hypothetical protein
MTISTADRLEIEDLAARYNLAIDLGDPAGWVSCFAPGGEFAIENVGPWSASALGLAPGRWSGEAELMAFASRVTSGRRVRHWSANRLLTPADGGVAAVSYMNICYPDLPSADRLLTGIMRDRLVHNDAGWRFAWRRIEFDR